MSATQDGVFGNNAPRSDARYRDGHSAWQSQPLFCHPARGQAHMYKQKGKIKKENVNTEQHRDEQCSTPPQMNRLGEQKRTIVAARVHKE